MLTSLSQNRLTNAVGKSLRILFVKGRGCWSDGTGHLDLGDSVRRNFKEGGSMGCKKDFRGFAAEINRDVVFAPTISAFRVDVGKLAGAATVKLCRS